MTPDNKIMDYVVGLEKNLLKVKEENEKLKEDLQAYQQLAAKQTAKLITTAGKNEQLKSNLKIAVEAIEREIKWRSVKHCTEDGLDNLGTALSKIGEL